MMSFSQVIRMVGRSICLASFLLSLWEVVDISRAGTTTKQCTFLRVLARASCRCGLWRGRRWGFLHFKTTITVIDMANLKNIHPGEILKEEFLGPMSISAYRLSKETFIPQT